MSYYLIKNDMLTLLSNEELIKMTKNRGVFMYMNDETMNQVRIKDLIGIDLYNTKLLDYTGLSFYRQSINRIEIWD